MTSLKELLLRAKGLSEGEIASLPASLEGKTGKDLRLLANTLSVNLQACCARSTPRNILSGWKRLAMSETKWRKSITTVFAQRLSISQMSHNGLEGRPESGIKEEFHFWCTLFIVDIRT